MNESGAFDEIPATAISANSDFSPMKFTTKKDEEEEVTDFFVTGKNLPSITTEVDEEITFVARKPDTGIKYDYEERLQRKSEDDICNTPKRERHEDQKLNIRSTRLLEMEEHVSIAAAKNNLENEDNEMMLMKTPQKQGEIVKSLSFEFEKKLASIHVSPKSTPPAISNAGVSVNETSNGHSPSSKPVRSMSPIRSVAQLSPVSKLNLNDEQPPQQQQQQNSTGVIETPKLISPSKIVAAATSVDIEKVKAELESKVNLLNLIIYQSIN